MPQYISDETKQEILRKIREEDVSVADASIDSGVSTKSIYRWLRDGVAAGNGSQNLVLENKRLKKEIEQLYGMLGQHAYHFHQHIFPRYVDDGFNTITPEQKRLAAPDERAVYAHKIITALALQV